MSDFDDLFDCARTANLASLAVVESDLFALETEAVELLAAIARQPTLELAGPALDRLGVIRSILVDLVLRHKVVSSTRLAGLMRHFDRQADPEARQAVYEACREGRLFPFDPVQGGPSGAPAPPSSTWTLAIGAFFLAAAAFVCGTGFGFILGWSKSDGNRYRLIFDGQRQKIAPVLTGSPDYSGVAVVMQSTGEARLEGRVPSRQAHDRLSQEMRRLFGDEDARRMMSGVEVADERPVGRP